MLLIDIARYQNVTSWQAVKDARIRITPGSAPEPIGAVYVKATDGNGYAPVQRADKQVRGAQSVDLPTGVYHFSQVGDPRSQARLLLSEHRRLGCTLPPMLDLEDNPPSSGRANIPHSQKTQWSKDFLDEVANAGYRPCVYMSSADAKSLRPDLWGIPNLVIWIASYGPNNGYRNALTGGYPGRVDIRQYTSLGSVPGISASGVDLNEVYVALTTEVDPLSWTENLTFTAPDGKVTTIQARDWVMWTNYAAWLAANRAEANGAAIAALANDPDITPEAMKAMVDGAIAAQMPLMVSSIISSLQDNLSETVLAVLGSDNAEQADLIVQRAFELISAKMAELASVSLPVAGQPAQEGN